MARWSEVRCTGCSVQGRYRDFKPFAGRDIFAETVQEMWVASDDPESWEYRSRGKVLGRIHAAKVEMWDYCTNHCPNWGLEDPDVSLTEWITE